jgi:hypothetical protein
MSESACIWADEEWPIPDAPKRLDPTSGSILAKLAAISDDDDCAWMTVPDLAKRVKCSERTVQTRLLALRGIETDQERKAREAAGKPAPAVYLRLTERTYRRGTRDVPIYELMVDYAVVAKVLERRKDGRRLRAEVAARPPKKARSMGATVCTHSGEADDASCTRMGATACTPNESHTRTGFANAHPLGARSPEGEAKAVLAACPTGLLVRTSVREIEAAIRSEVKRGADLTAIAPAWAAYVATPKAWGASGDAMAPHKLISSGRWETFVGKASVAKGSARARTAFACAKVRAAVVAAKGEAWVVSWLDPCGFDEVARVIDPRLKERGKKLRTEAGDVLKTLGVRVEGQG